MALQSKDLVDALASHAMGLGLFEAVNGHQPSAPPGHGLSLAIWVQNIGATTSGLASTSGLVVMSLRIYSPIIQEPPDMIDPAVMDAVDQLFAAYSGDFTLGGLVRQVDLLGQRNVNQNAGGLAAIAGYIEYDRQIYRTMTINLPLIINDLWDQAP